jgi:hydrogenase 3 maturation protease
VIGITIDQQYGLVLKFFSALLLLTYRDGYYLALREYNMNNKNDLSTLSFEAGYSHDADFLLPDVSASAKMDLSLDDLALAGINHTITPSAASAQMLDPDVFNHPCEKIILTVGNNMMGDDGAGPALAQKIIDQPLDGWLVIDGGTIPEDNIHILRRLQPRFLILVDAAEMNEPPGTVRVIDPDTIADMFIMSTHSLPLNFLLSELKLFIPRVEFIGIQPKTVAFSAPMTPDVETGVESIYQAFQSLTDLDTELPTSWLD